MLLPPLAAQFWKGAMGTVNWGGRTNLKSIRCQDWNAEAFQIQLAWDHDVADRSTFKMFVKVSRCD